MNGLLEKDFRLLMQRKSTLVVFLILAVVIGFSQDGTFILGYLPFLAVILFISTISYDELDNGYQFLMTLPITPGIYVREKYIFCISGGGIFWSIAVILYFASKFSRGEEILLLQELPMTLLFLPVTIVFLSIMIPLQLKFGAEKSRLVLVCACGAIAAVIFILVRLSGPGTLTDSLTFVNQIGHGLWGIMIVAATVIVAMISYFCSCKIMANKEL